MPEFNVQFPNVGRALGQAEAINVSRENRALRQQQFDAQQQAATTSRNQATQLAGLRERALGGDEQAARQMLVIAPEKAEAFMDAQAKALSVSRERLDDTYEDLARAGIAAQADPSKWPLLRAAVLRRNPHLEEDSLPGADADADTLSEFGDVMTALTINASESIKRRDAQAIANRPVARTETLGTGTPGETQPTNVIRDPRTGEVSSTAPIGQPRISRQPTGTTVNVNPGQTFKIPAGFMLKESADPSQGVIPIPGGPADRLSPEKATKLQLLEDALSDLNAAKQLIFQDGDVDKGDIDRFNLFTAKFGVPGTEGRELDGLILNAIEAKLRAESGAAVPETEVERKARTFIPRPGDTSSQIRGKINRMEAFFEGTISKTDPELAERLGIGVETDKPLPAGAVIRVTRDANGNLTVEPQ